MQNRPVSVCSLYSGPSWERKRKTKRDVLRIMKHRQSRIVVIWHYVCEDYEGAISNFWIYTADPADAEFLARGPFLLVKPGRTKIKGELRIEDRVSRTSKRAHEIGRLCLEYLQQHKDRSA